MGMCNIMEARLVWDHTDSTTVSGLLYKGSSFVLVRTSAHESAVHERWLEAGFLMELGAVLPPMYIT